MNLTSIIAISYSQDSDTHIENVISFTNFLRTNGYNCCMDQLLKQENSSIDFNEMMLKMIPEALKVVIVLTPMYKRKADNFEGGVGKEYRIINEDILHNNQKYILVSFSSLSETPVETILPHGLKGREIIDLVSDAANDYKLLFSKLSNSPIYNFVPVSSKKTVNQTITLDKFNPLKCIDKANMFEEIQTYLAENKQLLMQYGPNSLLAINNPLSESINIWRTYKDSTIIPNNKKIVNLIEKNINLLSSNEKEIFYKFKVHSDAFEHNQITRNDSDAVPTFPNEFEQMIYTKEDL